MEASAIDFACGECGDAVPLCTQYACRQCQRVECGLCVAEELESFFCPHCLDNLPSAEAALHGGRCSKCFECPVCGSMASNQQDPANETQCVGEKGPGAASRADSAVRLFLFPSQRVRAARENRHRSQRSPAVPIWVMLSV